MTARPPIDASVGTGRHDAEVPRWAAGDAAGPVGGDHEEIGVYPLDEHNAKLLDNVAPKAWSNPRPANGPQEAEMYYDLIAIGAGAGGLVSAKQSARRGLRSALIEKHMAGGDCLNVGCVPSKGLLRCARAAAEIRRAEEMGSVPVCTGPTHTVDFGRVMSRMREARARIAPADALEVSSKVGAGVFFGSAQFTSPSTVQVKLNDGGTRNLRFGKAVIATGGSAAVPPIPGIKEAPFHTNATLYNMTALPQSMVVIGAGPIGLEMAQAFALFGTQVTCVLRSDKLLSKEDPEAAEVVRASLEHDGVKFVTGITYDSVEVMDNSSGWTSKNPCYNNSFPSMKLTVSDKAGTKSDIICNCILVATGRKPNVIGLGLEAAGVEYDIQTGVKVDDWLRTTSTNIFAVGDVCSKHQFTHVSGTHAQMVVQNAMFGGDLRVSQMVIPWVTFTEPEVAHVGAYEHELKAQGIECDTYKSSFEHIDRAIVEGATDGFVKVHCKKGTEEIIGATIVAPAAGEMLGELTVALQFKVPLGASGMGRVIHSYPTMADAIGGCAHQCKMKSWARAQTHDTMPTFEVVPPKEVLALPEESRL